MSNEISKKSLMQNQSSNSAIELSNEELDLVAGGAFEQSGNLFILKKGTPSSSIILIS